MSWTSMSNSKMEGRMGFRDFECFNLALLAKQLWRILTRPCSLVATNMNEKYYKNGNLLEAIIRGSSY